MHTFITNKAIEGTSDYYKDDGDIFLLIWVETIKEVMLIA